MPELFEQLNPPPRLLMGPGPVNADPRVLQAMSMPLLGQFDPHFTEYMNEAMACRRTMRRQCCGIARPRSRAMPRLN